MTKIHFHKWLATGNDFVIIDNREGQMTNCSPDLISLLCHRNFGIGADGLMLINDSAKYDFEMKYYNSDGHEAEMCGNGARSIIGLANQLGIISNSAKFLALDGVHNGMVLEKTCYRIKMVDATGIKLKEDGISLNTGVPHHVIFADNIDQVNVNIEGYKIRYQEEFAPHGTNVNFVQFDGNVLRMRTYERGVEHETLSCGTGAVAAAIAVEIRFGYGKSEYQIEVPGGQLRVSFIRAAKHKFHNIYLEGEAIEVFQGTINI